MPYRSERQRRFMHAKRPEIAARWDRRYGGAIERTVARHGGAKGRRRRKHART